MDDWVNIVSIAGDIARVLSCVLLVGKSFFSKKKRPDSK